MKRNQVKRENTTEKTGVLRTFWRIVKFTVLVFAALTYEQWLAYPLWKLGLWPN